MESAGPSLQLVDEVRGEGDGRSPRTCSVIFGYLIMTSCTKCSTAFLRTASFDGLRARRFLQRARRRRTMSTHEHGGMWSDRGSREKTSRTRAMGSIPRRCARDLMLGEIRINTIPVKLIGRTLLVGLLLSPPPFAASLEQEAQQFLVRRSSPSSVHAVTRPSRNSIPRDSNRPRTSSSSSKVSRRASSLSPSPPPVSGRCLYTE
jgi:hypothetical protein